MKKKLEADLMSIAHRVLQIKNKSDINQLYFETQKLYEKLAILRFVEEHFGGSKPTIGQAEIVEKMKHFFEEIHITDPLIKTVQPEIIVGEIVVEALIEEENTTNNAAVEANFEEVVIVEIPEEEVKAVVEEIIVDEIPVETPEEEKELEAAIEEVPEIIPEEEDKELEAIVEDEIKIETTQDLGFLPAFELDVEVDEEETPKKSEEVQISFMDLLGSDYSEPMFVKVDQSEDTPSKIAFDLPKETNFQFDNEEITASIDVNTKRSDPKSVSLNDKFAKGITIGLNDRIAFVKHLFGNSNEDYNRVMNQLITYDNFEEAQNFIDDMVKPDYNSWEGKEDYSQRFLEIIEKKFA